MAEKTLKRPADKMHAALTKTAKNLSHAETLREGSIVFRLIGEGGGDFCLDCTAKKAKLTKGLPRRAELPLVEVFGDARRIRAILEGRKDARAQFLAGGLRIRGDLNYLSDLAVESGILKEPI
jgi:predicted lipid carrier protein YhbT